MAPRFLLAAKGYCVEEKVVEDDADADADADADLDSGTRFDDLPDSIIHEIFAFLEINAFVGLALLSKRFRKLCLSNPYVYLSSGPSSGGGGSKSNGNSFMSFLYNYMLQRDSAIFSLYLQYNNNGSCYEKERDTLDACLHQAAKCYVGALYLNFNFQYCYGANREPYRLPEALFSSNCLRVLDLDLHGHQIELPCVVIESLQVLKMNCSSLPPELALGEWISTHCPYLEELTLVYVKEIYFDSDFLMDLTVTTSGDFTDVVFSCDNLKALSLDLPERNDYRNGHLQISAPNLEFLKWRGSPRGDVDLGSFPYLDDATFYGCLGSNHRYESSSDDIFNIAKSTCSARVLRMPLSITEAMFLKDQEPILFVNLEELVINYPAGALKDYHTAVIADFVRRSPNLTSLVIKNQKDSSRSNYKVGELITEKARERNWEHEKLGQRVKEVWIQLSDGKYERSTSVDLVKYFIESAEKITIWYLLSCFDQLSVLFDNEITRASSSKAIEIVTHLEEGEEENRYDFY